MKTVVLEDASDVDRGYALAKTHPCAFLVHQIWFDLGAGPHPEALPKFARARASLREHLDDKWLVLQWGKGAAAEVARMCGVLAYAAMYAGYPLDIQRIDCVRYLLLCILGGWYVDMDFHAARSWDARASALSSSARVHFVESQHCVLGLGVVSNSLIYAPRSAESAKFFVGVLLPLLLQNRIWRDYQNRHMYVMASTGPAVVSRAYRAGLATGLTAKLPRSIWNPCSACMTDGECESAVASSGSVVAFHGNAGSWEENDSSALMKGYCSSTDIIRVLELASLAGAGVALGIALARHV